MTKIEPMYNNSMFKAHQPSSTHSSSNLLAYNKVGNGSFLQKENISNFQVNNNDLYKNKHLGLNPNLPIEDEYIENLLKQIHFMNMEIKLLKQKQSQSENNTLWGIVNRTNEPLVKNIIVSQEKYQDMKKQMDLKQEQLANDNIRLADQQNAILKEYQYLQEKLNLVKKKKETFNINFQDKFTKNNVKIEQYQDKLKSIITEKQIQKKKNMALTNQLEFITTESQKETSKNAYEMNKIKNDQIIQEQMQKQKIGQIEIVKQKIKILKQKFQSNIDYQKAQQEQIVLRQRIGNLDKNISGANFELMQLGQSIKMAQIEKQKEIKQRKRLTEQFQSVKTMLMEILLMNMGRKHKQSENRKRDSVQIQKAEYQTKKLQKNLEEIKKKLLKCEQTENQLRIEVESLERELEKLKKRREQLKTQLHQVTTKNEQQERIMLGSTSQVRKLDDVFYKTSNQEYLLSCELQNIEKSINYLRGRKDFLNETLNLKDTLNETKLEDLQRVVQKNIDLNETVGMLMNKWEEIKNFSRM